MKSFDAACGHNLERSDENKDERVDNIKLKNAKS